MKRLTQVSLSTIAAQPDRTPPRATHALPSGIVLLSGYEHVPGRGIDSLVGSIVKEGDLTIHYDIGFLAGNATTVEPGEHVWLQSIEQEGRTVDVAMRRDRILIVTISRPSERDGSSAYPPNFYATVRNEEDVAKMLLMVLGYTGQ